MDPRFHRESYSSITGKVVISLLVILEGDFFFKTVADSEFARLI